MSHSVRALSLLLTAVMTAGLTLSPSRAAPVPRQAVSRNGVEGKNVIVTLAFDGLPKCIGTYAVDEHGFNLKVVGKATFAAPAPAFQAITVNWRLTLDGQVVVTGPGWHTNLGAGTFTFTKADVQNGTLKGCSYWLKVPAGLEGTSKVVATEADPDHPSSATPSSVTFHVNHASQKVTAFGT